MSSGTSESKQPAQAHERTPLVFGGVADKEGDSDSLPSSRNSDDVASGEIGVITACFGRWSPRCTDTAATGAMMSPTKSSRHAHCQIVYENETTWMAAYAGHHPVVVENIEGIDYVISYDATMLSTFRALTIKTGTILDDPILLLETLLVMGTFGVVAATSTLVYGISSTYHFGLNHSVEGQEANMRMFTHIIMVLVALLLTFYANVIVGRWWTMRSQGIGGIKAASSDLQMLLSQLLQPGPEKDKAVDAIRRYARASLELIFILRRNQLHGEQGWAKLLREGTLTQDEKEHLENMRGPLPEVLWSWVVQVISRLHNEGAFTNSMGIKSDAVYLSLMKHSAEARAGIQCISTHLTVQVPLPYVHLLGAIVKVHNLILALIMGILFGNAFMNHNVIICIQLFARTMILPFLFNAILLINASLADPFDGGSGDFPSHKLAWGFDSDARSFAAAGSSLPDWLQEQKRALQKV